MVDLTPIYYHAFQEASKKGEAALQAGKSGEAAGSFRQCAASLRQYASACKDESIRKQWQQKAQDFEARAELLENRRLPGALGGESQKRLPGLQDDSYEAEALNLVEKTSVRWEDVGGLDGVKEAIKTAYGLALARKPPALRTGSGATNTILLYGPPGTGKTLLAAATAGSLEAAFFNVKLSNVLNKYVGESDKMLSALFAVARRSSPAVVYMDEFEALSPPRESTDNRAYTGIVSTLNMELQGLAARGDERFILVMASVNFPWLLDVALLSRFRYQVYVPLPDEAARRAILDIMLARRGYRLEITMGELAAKTAGFSGREIETLVQMAVTRMVHRANPDLLAVVDRGLKAIRSYELKYEPLTAEDFRTAFEAVRPAATLDLLVRYEEWQQKQ